MSAPELIVFGCLTPDNVVTAQGELLPQTYGGNCLYAALGARVWSDRVGVVSRYGRGYSEAPIERLRSLGIDTSGMRRLDIPHGRNVAFAYRADGSRTRKFPPELIARIPPGERARFIDTSLLPDADERWLQFAPDSEDVPDTWWAQAAAAHCAFMPVAKHLAIAESFRATRGREVWLQVDSPWQDRRHPEVDYATPLFSAIDALLPSEADVEAFRPGERVEDTALTLLDRGLGCVALKLGAAGCLVFAQGREAARVGVVPVRAIDPTGAGDAFCGGFLAGMQITGDVASAAEYGAVSASFAVRSFGLDGLANASREEANQRLKALGATIRPSSDFSNR